MHTNTHESINIKMIPLTSLCSACLPSHLTFFIILYVQLFWSFFCNFPSVPNLEHLHSSVMPAPKSLGAGPNAYHRRWCGLAVPRRLGSIMSRVLGLFQWPPCFCLVGWLVRFFFFLLRPLAFPTIFPSPFLTRLAAHTSY